MTVALTVTFKLISFYYILFVIVQYVLFATVQVALLYYLFHIAKNSPDNVLGHIFRDFRGQ